MVTLTGWQSVRIGQVDHDDQVSQVGLNLQIDQVGLF
jgi:hypothetical protein